jgi:hypothetical protein
MTKLSTIQYQQASPFNSYTKTQTEQKQQSKLDKTSQQTGSLALDVFKILTGATLFILGFTLSATPGGQPIGIALMIIGGILVLEPDIEWAITTAQKASKNQKINDLEKNSFSIGNSDL